jgi:AcrR family transcriptional regulator
MGVLSRDAGVAKGTLYLYFKTREEVLLAIYNYQLIAWCTALATSLTVDMTDQQFVSLLFQTIRRDPIFLQLVARLDSVIEHNVSPEALVESKKLMIDQIRNISPRLEECLDLSAGQVFDLLAALSALMLGAQQTDSGPSLEANNLPPEVRELINNFAAEKIFIPNACRILAGIRSHPAS